jgi:hypothetical protein
MKLNDEQSKIRDRIVALKARYDTDLALIEAAYVNAKEEAKQPLRELVEEAQTAGVPQRQIHLAFGFAQLSSLVSFLLPSKRVGGSLLYTGKNSNNPVVAAQATAKSRGITITQKANYAYWTDESGTERHVSRMHAPDGYYIMWDSGWDQLTDAEKAAFLTDGRLLAGDAEYDAFMDEGIEPERWATQAQ